MDLVDLMVVKRFIGQEFLTWLWWKSETSDGLIVSDGLLRFAADHNIHVVIGKKLCLEDGSGDEKLVCTGPAELHEAINGLALGKKLEQANIILTIDDLNYSFTLTGSLFELKGIKAPKTANTEASETMEGLILERIYLFNKLIETIHALFSLFLAVRIDPNLWEITQRHMSIWMSMRKLSAISQD